MRVLIDYSNMPEVTVNGREFVDKEICKEYLKKVIREDMEDADSQEEIDGMQQAIIRIGNL